MKKIALVDGGEICFRVSAGSDIRRWNVYVEGEEADGHIASFHYKKEATKYINGREELVAIQSIQTTSVSFANNSTTAFLRTIKEDTQADQVIVCFGHPKGLNFRNDIATFKKYKDRAGDRPHHYETVKSYIKNNFDYYETTEPYEDDDVLAILYNDLEAFDYYHPIICSTDKDLNQVPGRHYNIRKRELYDVSVVQGYRNFYNQLLSGDPTDTIPGIYYITGKKNTKDLSETLSYCHTRATMYQRVYFIYYIALESKEKSIPTDLDCILWEIGNLLYLRRSWDDEGWNFPLI